MIRVLLPPHIDDRAPALNAALHGLEGQTMGTSWQVHWIAGEGMDTVPVRAAIEQELDLVIAQMSTWLRDSDLDRYNRAAAGTWHALPAPFAQVMQAALQLAAWSGGAFNPAAGALVNLWGFGPSPRYTDPGFEPPQAEAVQHARAFCNWHGVKLESGALLQPGGVLLDLSAIAKGYAADRVAQRLSALGLRDALVEVGGELRGQGLRPGGQPWWVELEVPPRVAPHVPLPPTRLALHGLSVATSGDYRRVYTQGDAQGDAQGVVQRPHTIDPRTGWPITHGLASVSVVHAECMWADGWSTALTVLGLEQGLVLAQKHGIAALFVQRERDGSLREVLTPAMQEMAA